MAYSCLLRNPLPWLVVLGSLLAFSHSTNFGFLTILLTSSALILCPVIILRAKRCQKKSITREDSCGTSTEEVVLEPSIQDKVSSVNQSSSSEEELKKEQKEDKSRDTYLVRSSVEALLSDSESVDQTTSSEDSEVDWMFRENLSNDSINYSDGSISDEEELIEIALPTGHYVDSKRAQEQQSFFLILLMDFSSIVGASLHSPWMPFEALKWSSHKFKLMVDARKPMAWSSKIISKSPVERDEEPRINGIKKEDPNLFINIDINGN